MSENSSSFNESNALQQLPSTNSSPSIHMNCYVSGESTLIGILYMITRITLLLPLCVFVLYHGHPQWWPNRSPSAAISHCNCFTYHMVAMELMAVLGYITSLCGIFKSDLVIISMGNYLFALTWYGEVCFHILTCVERYLAVFHPVTFLTLKNERGIRLRNISIGFVWVYCCVAVVCVILNQFFIMDMCLLIFALSVISFCSFTVLWVLIQPGPGEKVRERTDRSKQKAFHTILFIWGVLLLKFVCNIIWEVVYLSEGLRACVILTSLSWGNLPSCLVLPLLYLHRAGKVVCCKTGIRSGKMIDLQRQITSETRK